MLLPPPAPDLPNYTILMPRPVHFEIHSADPKTTIEFYSQLFGWQFDQWGDEDYWLIKTGGENVYPREVEDVLGTHPVIADLSVIGLPDPDEWGEKVTAVVILKEGCALSLDEVKTHCRNKIAGYKIPKELKIVDVIPRNHTGKIKKLELKEQLKPM